MISEVAKLNITQPENILILCVCAGHFVMLYITGSWIFKDYNNNHKKKSLDFPTFTCFLDAEVETARINSKIIHWPQHVQIIVSQTI